MSRTQRAGLVWLMVSVAVAATAIATDSRGEVFTGLLGDYEAIRLALLNDGLEGVEQRAESLQRQALAGLERIGSSEAQGTDEESARYVDALEQVVEFSGGLADPEDLAAARSAMFELTRPMVLLRQLVDDQSTLVAYCSMSNKAWLQVAGDLGNPYMGQTMPACGVVVSK